MCLVLVRFGMIVVLVLVVVMVVLSIVMIVMVCMGGIGFVCWLRMVLCIVV